MLAPLIASMNSRWFLRASFFFISFCLFFFFSYMCYQCYFSTSPPTYTLKHRAKTEKTRAGWLDRWTTAKANYTMTLYRGLARRTSHFDGVPASFPRWSPRRCAFLSCHSLACSSGRLWSHASLERAKRACLLSSANNGYHCCCHCCCFWIGRWEVV